MGIELPHIDRTVGEDARYEEDFRGHLLDKWKEAGERIKDVEIDKTPIDVQIINFAKEAVLKYLREYGRQKTYDIPLDHIHILREGGTKKINKNVERGANDAMKGAVIIDRSPSDVDFALTVFHELFQLLCYKAVQILDKRGSNRIVDTYRSGLSVHDRIKGTPTLVDLEEGIVGLMTERFYKDFVSKDPRFEDEVGALLKSGHRLNFSRLEEREKIQRLVEDLYLANSDSFDSEKEVEEMFIRAQVTGNILPLGRLIERSFGRGSFREIEKS